MPRYFFNRTDGFVQRDTDGTEFEDLRAARLQAVVFAGESLRDNPKFVGDGNELRVEVMDQGGRLLLTITTLATEAPPPLKIVG